MVGLKTKIRKTIILTMIHRNVQDVILQRAPCTWNPAAKGLLVHNSVQVVTDKIAPCTKNHGSFSVFVTEATTCSIPERPVTRRISVNVPQKEEEIFGIFKMNHILANQIIL